jgi:hypothetical protein
MAQRKRRQRPCEFESLEERLALSSVVSGGVDKPLPQVVSEAIAATGHAKVSASFKATGTATPMGITTNPDGSFTVTATIMGSAMATGKKTTFSKNFGSFTGTITGTTGSMSSSTTIQFKKGTETINLSSTGTLATQGMASGTFTITNGTGVFAHSTGGGNFSAAVTGAGGPNPMLTFQFNGKVTVG